MYLFNREEDLYVLKQSYTNVYSAKYSLIHVFINETRSK